MYKHQWVVVRAIARLRQRGYDVSLTLIGDGSKTALKLLDEQVDESDPQKEFVQRLGFVPQKELPDYLASSDVFVFASSCENLPITLLEAMAVGMPIACSNCGPMPEVLEDGGVYFNPKDDESIAHAVETIMADAQLRQAIAGRARQLAAKYTWPRCGDETWQYIVETEKIAANMRTCVEPTSQGVREVG